MYLLAVKPALTYPSRPQRGCVQTCPEPRSTRSAALIRLGRILADAATGADPAGAPPKLVKP